MITNHARGENRSCPCPRSSLARHRSTMMQLASRHRAGPSSRHAAINRIRIPVFRRDKLFSTIVRGSRPVGRRHRYVNRATVSVHDDVVSIRNYRRCDASSPVNRNIPRRRRLLYLPNLFAHHEHHPSERVPSPPPVPSRGSFYFLFPLRTVLYIYIDGLVGLISLAPDRPAAISLA